MNMVPLGDLCHIRIGRTPSRANPEYWGGPIPWATISDLGHEPLETTLEGITEMAVRDGRMVPVPPGTLLYSFKLTIGKMAVTAASLYTNEAIAALVPRDPSTLDRDYLRFALATIDGSLGSSMAVKGRTLNLESLAKLSVRIVPIDEQRRTAAEVITALRVVDAARAAVAERDAKLDRLILACLGNRISTSPDSGWQEWRMRDAVQIQLGKMLSPASKVGTRPIPYLRNSNVQWDRFELSDVYAMDFTEAEERKFRLEPGDVLLCEGGEPGRAAIWAGEIERCCYQKALHRLRPIADAVDPRFLMYRLWLGALRGEFTDDQTATTIAHLPAVRLANLKVRLPSVNEQRRIAAALREELASIESMGSAIRAEQEAIEALPAALLRRAFQDVAA